MPIPITQIGPYSAAAITAVGGRSPVPLPQQRRSDAIEYALPGGTTTNTTVSSDGGVDAFSGGTSSNTTVRSRAETHAGRGAAGTTGPTGNPAAAKRSSWRSDGPA
jgi:hypothetical protein